VFIAIAIIFAITQHFILAYVKQSNKETRARALHLDITHIIVSIAQYVLVGMLAIVILQMLAAQQYNLTTLYISYAVSYGLWIVTLAILARAFFSWHRRSGKNVMVLMLTLSMIAYVINGVTGLATYIDFLTQQREVITSTDVAYFPEFSIASLGSQIAAANQIASSVAYILTWIGSVKLLYPYIKKLGKIKFWIIMGAAMVYYLVSFPLFVLGYYTPSEDVDAMTNILIFSLGGIFTGILFGAAFLSVARTLQKGTALRNQMIIAAYGLLVFYIAGSAVAAQAAYPPFGLASISIIGLSCYLIYTGLYSSAVIVSQDTGLRRSIRRSVTEQSKLLHSMGIAHMEQELQSRVLTVAKKISNTMVKETGVEPSMTENEMKEYIEMVKNEIDKS
jgi:MFS family permease